MKESTKTRRGVRTKLYFIALFFLISVTWWVAFNWSTAPQVIGYLLLISIYLLALFELELCPQNGYRWRRPLILLLVPLVPILIVIDPVEIGLVGHDAYWTLNHAKEFRSGLTITGFTDEYLSFPLYYAFAHGINIFVRDLELTAKYVPLLTAATPAMYYLGLRRLMAERAAYTSSVGVASIQTLLFFEAMFVDESLAVLLFSSLPLFGLIATKTSHREIIWPPLVAIALTHHFLAAVTLAFVGLWWGVHWRDSQVMSNLFRIDSRQFDPPASVVVIGCVFLSIALFLLYPFAQTVLRGLFQSLAAGPSASTGQVSVSVIQPSLQEMIKSIGGRVATGLVVGLAFLSVVSRRKIPEWEFSWALFGGGLAVVYVFTLAVGQMLNLGGTRLYLPMTIVLLPVAISYLHRSEWQARTVASYFVITIFVTAQIFALAPPLVYSDTSTGYVHHGHYTGPAHQAAETLATVGSDETTVVGYEPELWEVRGQTRFQRFTEEQWLFVDCSDALYAWKEATEKEFNIPRETFERDYNKIYDAGSISLSRCRIPPGLRKSF
ncbi:hypothetical protein [Haloarcula salina]|uniref:Uncharacterized protein n=1 Tax=Haloarcula salina TaxID=1429914 RepID=A0AA41KK01_9EURY|nr:hypothetical protein [Haloarcula salina]MBV0903308.1 hypothetical protein [Haloarcula salina]